MLNFDGEEGGEWVIELHHTAQQQMAITIKPTSNIWGPWVCSSYTSWYSGSLVFLCRNNREYITTVLGFGVR
jgi:hypothetical protein